LYLLERKTARAGALKLCQMVGPQIEENLSEYEPDWNQTTLGLFFGLSRSITIEILLLIGYNRVIYKRGGTKCTQNHINPKEKINFTKINEHTSHNMPKKQAQFHGDRTIGGTITVKKL